MRDYERDHLRPPARADRSAKAPDRIDAESGPVERGPALDTASVLHLQRTAGNQGVVQLVAGEEERSPVHDVVGSGGQPLDKSTRASMESAFGTSFEDVRVHTDDRASKSAESVGANAYTVGSDMVFRSGHFDPGTPTGQRTIAHELSHVVQQSRGPVDGSNAPGGIRVSHPSDRFEQAADHEADRVMSSVGSGSPPAPSVARSGDAVQREEEEGAHPHVQREAAPEEEEEMLG